jgi:hypothetical protein
VAAEERLVGLWFRSFEEEDGSRTVYRGRSYAFPPSRAPRPSLQLDADHGVVFGGPGPADETVGVGGGWDVEAAADEEVLVLRHDGWDERYVIEHAGDEHLVLRPAEGREHDDGEQG